MITISQQEPTSTKILEGKIRNGNGGSQFANCTMPSGEFYQEDGDITTNTSEPYETTLQDSDGEIYNVIFYWS